MLYILLSDWLPMYRNVDGVVPQIAGEETKRAVGILRLQVGAGAAVATGLPFVFSRQKILPVVVAIYTLPR